MNNMSADQLQIMFYIALVILGLVGIGLYKLLKKEN